MMLLTIIASPAIEEELIDWLLTQANINGFTSQPVNGHGRSREMSLAEQVMGHRKQVMFMIELQKQMTERMITDLKLRFSGSGLHYWLMPLSESGRI